MKARPKPPTVLIVPGASNDSFILDDIRLITRFACAITFLWKSPPGTGTRLRFVTTVRNLAAFSWVLLSTRPAIVVFWFATTPSLLLALIAKLFRRRIVVITGGWDSVYLPEIHWGQLRGPRQRFAFRTFVWLADAVLPFSDSARNQILATCRAPHVRTVYPAVDTEFFQIRPGQRKRRVVTCCYQYDESKIIQKGLARLACLARRLPDLEFVVVGNAEGESARQFQAAAPANMSFLPRIPSRSEYRRFLQESSVYTQLSYHEGFGISLAEAMACGCLPVVFDRYSLPEVVGSAGFVVPFADEEAAAFAILSAAEGSEEQRLAARQRVTERFDTRFRYQSLFDELARLVPSLTERVMRVELGCGESSAGGTIGVDLRATPATCLISDVRRTPFASHTVDEVYSYCVLEHLRNPYELLDEVVRILKPDGRAYLRVPNLGTFSAHLDPTHCFLGDLRMWKTILGGYFETIAVIPLGTKYRDSKLLVLINVLLVRLFRFFELTQGWEFVCQAPKREPSQNYIGWWMRSPR